jgi:E3 ubiquitin-protein ligase TRIP12
LYDILSFDAEFGKILQELQILVERKRFLESSSDENKQIEELRLRGAPIEDLCLDFTLPGYPDYILKEGGENVVVSNGNLVP